MVIKQFLTDLVVIKQFRTRLKEIDDALRR